MISVSRWVTALCLGVSLATASAHDMNTATSGMQSGSKGMYSARYNPWRPQPTRTWSNPGNNGAAHVPEIQVLPQAGQYPGLPVHPLHARQFEYHNYLHQYGVNYGSYHSGLPWWSDPVAVPYGPWVSGYGWPNGIW